MKKNGKKRKKRKKLEVFYAFGFLKNWLKIGHFGGLRASLGEEGREPPKRKKQSEKKEKILTPNEKNEKTHEKKHEKKARSFLPVLDFSKMG